MGFAAGAEGPGVEGLRLRVRCAFPTCLSPLTVSQGKYPPRVPPPHAETLLLPELGPSMAPEDHYRRLVSALSEAGSFEDPQRLYHLGLPSHGMCPPQKRVSAADIKTRTGSVSGPQPLLGRR